MPDVRLETTRRRRREVGLGGLCWSLGEIYAWTLETPFDPELHWCILASVQTNCQVLAVVLIKWGLMATERFRHSSVPARLGLW